MQRIIVDTNGKKYELVKDGVLYDRVAGKKRSGYRMVEIDDEDIKPVLLTGEEWFNKFIEEMKADVLKTFNSTEQNTADSLGKEVVAVQRCVDAARKATDSKPVHNPLTQ
jgi:hypothetical protein